MFRWEDMLVILGVALLLFGPNKIKDIASSLGGAVSEFKKAMNPDLQNAQPATASAQPVSVQAAQAPVRRRKPVAKKKAKAAR
jgi:sec-independent protein translocase protein TatA